MPLFEGLGSGGEKTAVVVDLGAAYTKCGFAGETGPRFVIPSEIKRAGSPEVVRVVQYNINTEELYSILKEFVHLLYFRHLLVNPRDRRVVIVESILCPSHFRETLSRVFFKHFEVPSVMFAPSHLMSVMTLGIQSALVMDCGYTETLIYEGIPILSAWEALPMGGKAIHRELHSLLSEQCTLDTDSSAGLSLPTVVSSIPEEVVEDIKVRTCFVSDLQRGMKIQEAKFNMDGSAEVREHCPVDTRKVLSENLVIIGGTAMLPGFLHRLLAEIRSLVEKPKYHDALATKSFRFHSPPAKPNCTAWLGGAIFGALQDILGSRSVSRDYYSQTGRIPDWCCLSTPLPDSVYEAGKTPPPFMKRAFSTEK
uniref:Actin-related protein 10-like n=1 Tax=Sinocyclocheilus anshuiensis TaxID=1608454 RepID=A0A671MIS4_9TELE